MIEKGKITSELPERIAADQLQNEIDAVFGPDKIGVSAQWDKEQNLVALNFEYDVALGVDEKKLKEVLRAHVIPEGADDDFQATEKRQAAEAQQAIDLAHVLKSYKELESRLAVVEALLGVSQPRGQIKGG